MKRLLAICLSPIILVGCVSVNSIRDAEPKYRAKANSDVVTFRECVFDHLTGRQSEIRQTEIGVVSAESRNELAFIIEQADGYVTVYKGLFSTAGYLPEWATKKCNNAP